MSWWQRLWDRRRMEEQLEKELRFHIEQHAADLIAQGHDPEEARRQARLALGGPEQVKEMCRDARGTRWVEDLWHDLRYALRTLAKNPGFTAVALLTLTLGIGVTTVMFTVINGVLLKPLPYMQPEKLVAVHSQTDTWNTAVYGEQNVAYPDFLDCQRESHSLELGGMLFNGATLSSPGEPEYLDLREITSELFSVLRVRLFRGRAFLSEEDRAGGAPVAILGYSFWQRHFDGNPSVIGTSVVVDGRVHTVVGIAPASFRPGDQEPDVLTPIGQDMANYLHNRQAHPVTVFARLRPGATLGQAQSELGVIGQRLAKQYADTNKGRSLTAKPLRPEVGEVRSTLWLLLGAVTLVMLIACANVASLLLARAVSREREFAVRVVLGAGRSRLIRQCLTESAVLGLSGGVLGVVLAAVGIGPFVKFWPGSLPRAAEVQLDWRVLLFAIGVSLFSGFLFGLAPALRAPARHLEQTLRAGARTVVGSSRRLHGVFVAAEIALAIVLLVAAGILGRTLLRVSSLDPGVNVHNLLITRVALSPSTLADAAKIRVAWQDILDRGQRVPGVESIAAVDTVPMREGNNQLGYWTNADVPPQNQLPFALATSVTPDYLKVMGIPLREGRFFNVEDRIGRSPVIVIDDVLAQQAFGGQEAVGKRLWIPDMGTGPYQVVGVVGHVRHWGLASDDQALVRAQLYYPFEQVEDGLLRRWSELMSITVRTGVAPLSVVEPLRRELRGTAGDQVLYEVRTMEQLASGSLGTQHFLLLLFGIFAGLALLLACVGIYGVLAYLVSRRVPEIGVRMALGATPRDVMQLVLRESMGMIFAGAGVGAIVAAVAARLLARWVAGVRSAEPWTFALMVCVLVAAAIFASFLPARRASRLDPNSALRQE